ncbi:hypothetical protein D4764_04G0012230 [Takifugu flavidus]|uniref:Uncharacterized protein n=1 Tax=Takifugu flavidus TaxID=433684 RepID=A0A5C6N5I3_9TELE|nr:hypothetical protein D4764_04G0012230 [Takifugu flavidus]
MEDLRSAMILAQGNSAVEQNHQSDQYNKRVRGLPLSVGDRVLLANKGVKGKRKLSDKWEAVVYDVVASKPDLHIYKIRDQAGNEKTVHRNLLLQVNFLPLDVSLDVTKAQSAVGVDVVPEEPGVSVGQSPNERMEPDVMSCDCPTEFAGPPLVPCDENIRSPQEAGNISAAPFPGLAIAPQCDGANHHAAFATGSETP